MRLPGKVGIDHFDLAGRVDQKFELAPGDRHYVAHCLQPGVIPDAANLAIHIGQRSLAGRIDQFAMIRVGEVLENALVEIFKDSLGCRKTARRSLG